PVVVVLRSPDERQKSAWDTSANWLGIGHRDAQWPQVYVETRGTGGSAWGPHAQWHLRRAATITGRTIASVQVYDTLRALDALSVLSAFNDRGLVLAGKGQMAVVALYAALLDQRIEAI